jgi:hypothetical protein
VTVGVLDGIGEVIRAWLIGEIGQPRRRIYYVGLCATDHNPTTAATSNAIGLSAAVASERRVEVFEKTAQGFGRPQWDELHTILIYQRLNFLAWFQPKALTDSARYDDLKFWRNGHNVHNDLPLNASIDHTYNERYIDRHCVAKRS